MGKLYTKLRHLFFRDSRKETLLYLALWLLLFLTPLFSIYVRLAHAPSTASFPWTELLLVWRQLAIFLVMFLVHNFVLAPLLVYRQRRALYFSSLAVMLGIFLVLQCGNKPHEPMGGPPMHRDFIEWRMHDGQDKKHGDHLDAHDRFGEGPRDHFEDGGPRDHFEGDGPREGFMPPTPPDSLDFGPHGPHRGPHGLKGDHKPPIIFGEHDIVAIIIFVLMLGMNLGVKLYFRQQKDHDRMMKLENDNLEQQLEYLKYQINPHFLMNTLNNIHALVDIDPEQAKETIVELSKIMRFVLYEGSKQKVPLRQELLFLENYIGLMKMRYSDQVAISVTLPDMLPDREIPPLLLITFVENAFKHGVSYRQHSFIDICISIEGENTRGNADDGGKSTAGGSGQDAARQLRFTCRNSKLPRTEDSHGGVGLTNARRRLDLLYGKAYQLDINDADDTYTVTLCLPL